MSDETYCYPPDFKVLRNRFNIRDASKLGAVEREFVAQRIREPIPSGKFDLAHIKAIHRHLFQDIYEWAGKIRTVEISKGDSQFQFMRFIETGMADVHRRLVRRDFLGGLDGATFAREAGQILVSRGKRADADTLPSATNGAGRTYYRPASHRPRTLDEGVTTIASRKLRIVVRKHRHCDRSSLRALSPTPPPDPRSPSLR